MSWEDQEIMRSDHLECHYTNVKVTESKHSWCVKRKTVFAINLLEEDRFSHTFIQPSNSWYNLTVEFLLLFNDTEWSARNIISLYRLRLKGGDQIYMWILRVPKETHKNLTLRTLRLT